jgi:hypothetical protein
MSDGMSDSRPYSTEVRKYDGLEEFKFKKPLEVHVYEFRDCTVLECYAFDIQVGVPSWGTFHVEDGAADGGDAVAFAPVDSAKKAEEVMKKAIIAKLRQNANFRKRWVV